jgi:hypothetical protein
MLSQTEKTHNEFAVLESHGYTNPGRVHLLLSPADPDDRDQFGEQANSEIRFTHATNDKGSLGVAILGLEGEQQKRAAVPQPMLEYLDHWRGDRPTTLITDLKVHMHPRSTLAQNISVVHISPQIINEIASNGYSRNIQSIIQSEKPPALSIENIPPIETGHTASIMGEGENNWIEEVVNQRQAGESEHGVNLSQDVLKVVFQNADKRVVIEYDTAPISPRRNDSLGNLHLPGLRNYRDPSEHSKLSQADRADLEKRGGVVLPIYAYQDEHLTLSADPSEISKGPYTDPIQAGEVGYIYVDANRIQSEYGGGIDDPQIKQGVIQALSDEVAQFGRYLDGEVYQAVSYTRDENGPWIHDDTIDSIYSDLEVAGEIAADELLTASEMHERNSLIISNSELQR